MTAEGRWIVWWRGAPFWCSMVNSGCLYSSGLVFADENQNRDAAAGSFLADPSMPEGEDFLLCVRACPSRAGVDVSREMCSSFRGYLGLQTLVCKELCAVGCRDDPNPYT